MITFSSLAYRKDMCSAHFPIMDFISHTTYPKEMIKLPIKVRSHKGKTCWVMILTWMCLFTYNIIVRRPLLNFL